MPFWKCPICGRQGRGPVRPRRNATVRYCLPCSAKEGTLVERTAPALEAKRTARQERAKTRQSERKARQKARVVAALTVGDLDLVAELARLWRLPTIREARELSDPVAPTLPQRARTPRLEIRRSATKPYTSGRAWVHSGRIVLTVAVNPDPIEVAVVLLHEVVHCALPSSEHHGSRFWSYFAQAAEEAWPGAQVHYAGGRKRDKHKAVEDAVRACQPTTTGGTT
jgi:hypothetical protein